MSDRSPSHESLRVGRLSEGGLCYFITTVVRHRTPLFENSELAGVVMDSLMWLDRKKKMSLVCAVVMPDHLHFVAYLEASTLSSVMHSLKSFTANQINKLLGREGSVWEPQYFEKCLRDERSFTEAIRYCLRNPVVSGMVDSPGDYPFLFCRFEVEEEVPPPSRLEAAPTARGFATGGDLICRKSRNSTASR